MPNSNQQIMNSISKRLIAGFTIAILANALSSCSPVFVAQSRPRPVIYSTPVPAPAPEPVYASTLPPAPVQTVVVTPVVPVWAPPYVYVNEVHYYYFPDYMVYYDVFAQNYWYFDGFSWVHVVSLPSIQTYYGFDPFTSYIVVMNRNTHNPWLRHSYFEHQYPRGYYKTAIAPRQSLGNNVSLRAYDENESRPVFVDKRSNKEVKVKYEMKNVKNVNSQPSANPGNNSVGVKETPQNISTGKPRSNNSNGIVKDTKNQNSPSIEMKHPTQNNPKAVQPVNNSRPAPKMKNETMQSSPVAPAQKPKENQAFPSRSTNTPRETTKPQMMNGPQKQNHMNIMQERPKSGHPKAELPTQPRGGKKK